MSNPPRSLLFVHPRRQSLAIGQVCSSPQAPKGRWGSRAFKRRASAHSSLRVAREHFAGSRQCVYFCRTRVYIVARDGREVTVWCAHPARLTSESSRSIGTAISPANFFGACRFSRSFVSLGSVELSAETFGILVGWIILTAV